VVSVASRSNVLTVVKEKPVNSKSTDRHKKRDEPWFTEARILGSYWAEFDVVTDQGRTVSYRIPRSPLPAITGNRAAAQLSPHVAQIAPPTG
jgi:hypothetical protein